MKLQIRVKLQMRVINFMRTYEGKCIRFEYMINNIIKCGCLATNSLGCEIHYNLADTLNSRNFNLFQQRKVTNTVKST